MKECTGCGLNLEESSFYKDKNYKSGRMSRCKECIKAQRKEEYAARSDQIKARVAKYRKENREKVRQQDSKYRKSERGIAKRKENYRKNIERHRANDRRRYENDWFRRKATYVKSKCKRQGLEYDLSPEWLEEQFDLQQGRCYWTGVEMDHSSKLFRPSLDRLAPGGGYTKDNVVLTTYFCNMGRINASIEEMTEMAEALRRV